MARNHNDTGNQMHCSSGIRAGATGSGPGWQCVLRSGMHCVPGLRLVYSHAAQSGGKPLRTHSVPSVPSGGLDWAPADLLITPRVPSLTTPTPCAKPLTRYQAAERAEFEARAKLARCKHQEDEARRAIVRHNARAGILPAATPTWSGSGGSSTVNPPLVPCLAFESFKDTPAEAAARKIVAHRQMDGLLPIGHATDRSNSISPPTSRTSSSSSSNPYWPASPARSELRPSSAIAAATSISAEFDAQVCHAGCAVTARGRPSTASRHVQPATVQQRGMENNSQALARGLGTDNLDGGAAHLSNRQLCITMDLSNSKIVSVMPLPPSPLRHEGERAQSFEGEVSATIVPEPPNNGAALPSPLRSKRQAHFASRSPLATATAAVLRAAATTEHAVNEEWRAGKALQATRARRSSVSNGDGLGVHPPAVPLQPIASGKNTACARHTSLIMPDAMSDRNSLRSRRVSDMTGSVGLSSLLARGGGGDGFTSSTAAFVPKSARRMSMMGCLSDFARVAEASNPTIPGA